MNKKIKRCTCGYIHEKILFFFTFHVHNLSKDYQELT